MYSETALRRHLALTLSFNVPLVRLVKLFREDLRDASSSANAPIHLRCSNVVHEVNAAHYPLHLNVELPVLAH